MMKKKYYYIPAAIIALFLLVQFTIVGQIIEIGILNSFESTEATVKGDTLHLNGLINAKTPAQIRKIFKENPNIDTIFIDEIEGSVDDEANLDIAFFVAQQGITTKIGRDSLIASGGTDFFLAGKHRIVEDGAWVGVHSWQDSQGLEAVDFPRGAKEHQPYIDFYIKAGFSQKEAEDFYYFTIESSPADSIYLMSNEEIIQYKISNTGITPPEYINLEKEEERKSLGLPYITAEQAKARGIKIKDNNN